MSSDLLLRTIAQVEEKLPELREALYDDLKSLKDSIPYTAPEMMWNRWAQFSRLLGRWCVDHPKHESELNALWEAAQK